MEMLYQLSYNGTRFVFPPATCCGTEQVVIGVGKAGSWRTSAISSDFEVDLVFTINHR